jgi:LmbE family N-acetylglucosaminyl deacetylase
MRILTQINNITRDFYNRDRVVVIAAHPDDIEFGCFGTLLKWHSAGSRVVEFIATNGSGGGDSFQRTNEALSSAKLIDSRIREKK